VITIPKSVITIPKRVIMMDRYPQHAAHLPLAPAQCECYASNRGARTINALYSLCAARAFASCLVTPAFAECRGDFEGDGQVTVSEVVSVVNGALTGCDPLPGPRFVDNGDGTVTDSATGLEWEQKVGGTACRHGAERQMDWRSAMGDWLSEVNGFIPNPQRPESQAGLGGHTDWRVPTLAELRGILDPFPCEAGCFSPTLGPSIVNCHYWTSTTPAANPRIVNTVVASSDTTIGEGKGIRRCVRAVPGVRR